MDKGEENKSHEECLDGPCKPNNFDGGEVFFELLAYVKKYQAWAEIAAFATSSSLNSIANFGSLDSREKNRLDHGLDNIRWDEIPSKVFRIAMLHNMFYIWIQLHTRAFWGVPFFVEHLSTVVQCLDK